MANERIMKVILIFPEKLRFWRNGWGRDKHALGHESLSIIMHFVLILLSVLDPTSSVASDMTPVHIEVRKQNSLLAKRKITLLLKSDFSFTSMCPGLDVNQHAVRRYHLKVVGLPISPPGQVLFLRRNLRKTSPDYTQYYLYFQAK